MALNVRVAQRLMMPEEDKRQTESSSRLWQSQNPDMGPESPVKPEALREGDCDRFLDSAMKERRQKDREERLSLVVWKRPLTTLQYFLLEALIEVKEWTFK